MKVRLLHSDRDFDPKAPLPPQAKALVQDLDLETLLAAMADGDEFLHETAKRVILANRLDDPEAVRYRQEILRDCLRSRPVVQNLYDTAVEAIEGKRKHWFGIFGKYPGSILYGSIELLQMHVGLLRRLRLIAEEHGPEFESDGFRNLFGTFKAELGEDYLTLVTDHLQELKFKYGVLVSAELGEGNQGKNYVLRKNPAAGRPSWIRRILGRRSSDFTIRIDPHDEAGARAITELRDRGINSVANALAQSADHIQGFFATLRSELGFHLGCANLRRRLVERGCPVCFPTSRAATEARFACMDLRDPCLVLNKPGEIVGNDVEGEGRRLVVVTGANQGGKSTFLRSVGLAQLMMQSGMFAAAGAFEAAVCRGIFTHFKREEDKGLESGKFDEELRRMSGIVGQLAPETLLLCNESFASTHELEGSEIARQIVRALLEARVRIFYVTHLHDFARRLWEEERTDTLFLRADRETDGRRTYRLRPAGPLETSFGADLFEAVFGSAPSGPCGSTEPRQPAAILDEHHA